MANHRDLLIGVLLILFAGALFFVTFGFEEVPAAFAQGMQAASMPRLLLGLIAVFSGVMIIQGWAHPEPTRETPPWRFWATVGVLAFAGALLAPLGVGIVAFITCLAIPVIWGERFRLALVVYALSAPIGIYLVFAVALQLRLPQGPLQGLLY